MATLHMGFHTAANHCLLSTIHCAYRHLTQIHFTGKKYLRLSFNNLGCQVMIWNYKDYINTI